MSDPQVTDKPLTHVGFFHFGTRAKGAPIEMLQCRLELEQAKGTNLAECLLVLPEAFNIVGDYGPQPADPSIRLSLIALSRDSGIAFVVGLMEQSESGRFNKAYLIDGDLQEPLAYKLSQDSAGEYIPRKYFREVTHRGHTIAALICLDAIRDDQQYPTLHGQVKAALVRAKSGLLCVPAHFRAEPPRQIADVWAIESKVIVIANSSDQQPSLIFLRGESPTPSRETNAASTNPHYYASIILRRIPM